MLRNLGGAVGTIITKREQFHSNINGQAVTISREEVRQRIAPMTDYFKKRTTCRTKPPRTRRP